MKILKKKIVKFIYKILFIINCILNKFNIDYKINLKLQEIFYDIIHDEIIECKKLGVSAEDLIDLILDYLKNDWILYYNDKNINSITNYIKNIYDKK